MSVIVTINIFGLIIFIAHIIHDHCIRSGLGGYNLNISLLHRGYYVTAWRYEIFLRVLKNISRVSALNE